MISGLGLCLQRRWKWSSSRRLAISTPRSFPSNRIQQDSPPWLNNSVMVQWPTPGQKLAFFQHTSTSQAEYQTWCRVEYKMPYMSAHYPEPSRLHLFQRHPILPASSCKAISPHDEALDRPTPGNCGRFGLWLSSHWGWRGARGVWNRAREVDRWSRAGRRTGDPGGLCWISSWADPRDQPKLLQESRQHVCSVRSCCKSHWWLRRSRHRQKCAVRRSIRNCARQRHLVWPCVLEQRWRLHDAWRQAVQQSFLLVQLRHFRMQRRKFQPCSNLVARTRKDLLLIISFLQNSDTVQAPFSLISDIGGDMFGQCANFDDGADFTAQAFTDEGWNVLMKRQSC